MFNEKRPMLYNGIFGCHGNKCYVIFINAYLQGTWHRCNKCLYTNFEINRRIGTKLTNLENMQKSYVLFDVT